MTANISAREYIRWEPDAASEPTSTLVLTSHERRFVDIRILKLADGEDGKDEVGDDILHFARLDWAFAGTSSSELLAGPDGQQIVHSKWAHWVSDRTTNVDGVVDEGDMFPASDGRTIERGRMVNPATGVMTEYEECWVDVEPLSTTSRAKGDITDGKRNCTVLMLDDDVNKARGMVVRVGHLCQGVLRMGEQYSLERWAWNEDGGWRRQARMGDLWLPCGVVLDGGRLRLGGEVRHGEYLWKVVELTEF